MKTLIIDTTINAHTESFSAQLLQQIKQQFAESTIYLPLNDMDLPTLDEATLTVIYKQKAGEALSVAEQAIADTRQAMLQQFKAHQKIVTIYPMYNYNVPARLKVQWHRYEATADLVLHSDGEGSLKWLLKQDTVNPYLAETCKNALEQSA